MSATDYLGIASIPVITNSFVPWAPGRGEVWQVDGCLVLHPNDLWRLKPEPNFEPDADFPRDCPPEGA